MQHTTWLCLSFGALFSAINPALNSVFDAHFNSLESRAMVRHFGVAMLFVGSLCHFLPSSPEFTSLLLAWHGGVMGCWLVELGYLNAFRTCPMFTRMSVYSGVVGQFLLLCEGLLQVEPQVRIQAAIAASITAAATALSARASQHLKQ